MKTALLDTICPVCHQKLEVNDDHFYCISCGKMYPTIAGIPILLKESHLLVFESRNSRSEPKWRRIIRGLLEKRPDLHCSTATKKNIEYLARYLSPKSRLLFVGGGLKSYGKYIPLLGDAVVANSINLEIEPGPIVDVIADGHDIPFPADYFDVIICQAVLEHTAKSDRVVDEVYRVLKPDGLVYAEIPFIAPIHMRSDFRRFTLLGTQELFNQYTIKSIGVNGAVASSFAMIATSFCATFFSLGNASLYQVGRFIFSWIFAPIKYMDWIFSRYSTATIAASSVFILGVK